ncbi:hypothetical protein GQR58_024538 [Nymphon striatum]|nr:hypothetical protein GQR58_024538 [Nymphon striatum]
MQEILTVMQSFAVIPVAKGVIRAELMQLQQAPDEQFRPFAARVMGKAETCGFSTSASCQSVWTLPASTSQKRRSNCFPSTSTPSSSSPSPTCTTDIRSWFGLVNQVANYAELRDAMAQFRPFLSPKYKFFWSPILDQAFLESKEVINVGDQPEESLWLLLQFRSALVTFGTIYFPSPNNSNIEHLDNFLNSLTMDVRPNLILCGDFNIDHMPNKSSYIRTNLETCCNSHGLSQVINKPTRITTTSKTLIDLVFVTDPSTVVLAEVGCPLDKSDHNTASATLDYRHPLKPVHLREIWQYIKANWPAINSAINSLPESFYDMSDINMAWDQWYNFYLNIMKSHVPCL